MLSKAFKLTVLLIVQAVLTSQQSCTLPNSSRRSTCIRFHHCNTLQNEYRSHGGRPPQEVIDKFNAHKCPERGFYCCPDGAPGGAVPPPPPPPTSPSTNTETTLASNQLIRPNGKIIPELVGHKNLNLINEKNCGVESTFRIVGGESAILNEIPWMALLKYRDRLEPSKTRFACGGTLITRRYVLTAAHCIYSDLIEVRLGEHTLSTAPDCDQDNNCAPHVQDIRIQTKIKYPQYSAMNRLHDIALLRLEREANTAPKNVRTVCLPTEVDETLEKIKILKQNFTISGWGFLGDGSQENSDILQKAAIPYVEQDDCIRQFKRIRVTVHETYLCAGGKRKVDACRGDSGGPITNYATVNGRSKTIIYGVVSGGIECEDHDLIYPGVYTNVRYYLKWILDNLQP